MFLAPIDCSKIPALAYYPFKLHLYIKKPALSSRQGGGARHAFNLAWLAAGMSCTDPCHLRVSFFEGGAVCGGIVYVNV